MKPSMRTFYIIWFGQLVSTLGSGLTGFALGVWLYQATESVTLFAVSILMLTVPQLVMTPLAGALADRVDRRILRSPRRFQLSSGRPTAPRLR